MKYRRTYVTRLILLVFGLYAVLLQADQTVFNANEPEKNNTPVTCIGFMSIDNSIKQAKPIIQKLLKVAKDPKIKGLILHFENCTGGNVGTSQAIFSEIKKLKKEKPVIVIIENGCYSAGYYIAAAADFIFALPSSQLGSIGVRYIMEKYRELKFNHKDSSGVMDVFVVKSGKYKDLANPYTPLEDHAIDYVKTLVQKMYEQFVADIAQARNLSIQDEKIWADGKEFVGTQALELGLIDGLGDFTDSKTRMKELLELRSVKVEGELEIVEI